MQTDRRRRVVVERVGTAMPVLVAAVVIDGSGPVSGAPINPAVTLALASCSSSQGSSPSPPEEA